MCLLLLHCVTTTATQPPPRQSDKLLVVDQLEGDRKAVTQDAGELVCLYYNWVASGGAIGSVLLPMTLLLQYGTEIQRLSCCFISANLNFTY